LGDRDIALHLLRREQQSRGLRLTQISQWLARQFGVPSELLPMCDAPAPTTVLTEEGGMPFQEYFVKHQCRPAVRGFHYGGGACELSPEIRAALDADDIDGIILCPSNPYLSIAPILAVPGLRERLARSGVPVIAVSPIVGGDAVKGPAAKIMRELDLPVSPVQIAGEYADFLDVMLIDEGDAGLLEPHVAVGPRLRAGPIMMRTQEDRRALAEFCVQVLRTERDRKTSAPQAAKSTGR
jgi:LPPG:FO 2-phospho-L-lactate transferase